MFKLKNLFPILSLLLLFTACEDDEPVLENEEEVITTATLTLFPVGGTDTMVLSFEDLDGDGGQAPIISGATLSANTEYTGVLSLFNASVDPPENIGIEVQEEGEEHQIFYLSEGGLEATVAYTDEDDKGRPIGLETTLTTGAASTGTLRVILRHEPSKDASGVEGGDISNAGGETDIEVDFPVTVQ